MKIQQQKQGMPLVLAPKRRAYRPGPWRLRVGESIVYCMGKLYWYKRDRGIFDLELELEVSFQVVE